MDFSIRTKRAIRILNYLNQNEKNIQNWVAYRMDLSIRTKRTKKKFLIILFILIELCF